MIPLDLILLQPQKGYRGYTRQSPAKPSIPSHQLMTVVTPNIQVIVNNNCNWDNSIYIPVNGFVNPLNIIPVL